MYLRHNNCSDTERTSCQDCTNYCTNYAGQNMLYSSFVDKSYQRGDLSHNKLTHTDAQ